MASFFVVSGAGAVVAAIGGLAALLGKKGPRVGSLVLLVAISIYASAWVPYQSKRALLEIKRLVADQSAKSEGGFWRGKIRSIATTGSVVQASDTVAILAGLQPMVFKASELTPHDLPTFPSFTYRALIVERTSLGPIWR